MRHPFCVEAISCLRRWNCLPFMVARCLLRQPASLSLSLSPLFFLALLILLTNKRKREAKLFTVHYVPVPLSTRAREYASNNHPLLATGHSDDHPLQLEPLPLLSFSLLFFLDSHKLQPLAAAFHFLNYLRTARAKVKRLSVDHRRHTFQMAYSCTHSPLERGSNGSACRVKDVLQLHRYRRQSHSHLHTFKVTFT